MSESDPFKDKNKPPVLRKGLSGRYNVVSTGIPKIDEILGGGFLSNSIVLIAHQTSYRFTEFADWKLVYESGKNFFIILVDYCKPVEDLYCTAGVSEFSEENSKGDKTFISMDRVRIINCFSGDVWGTKNIFGDKVYNLDDPFDCDKLFSTMKSIRESLPEKSWAVWVFDSLTDLSIGVPEHEIVKFFRRASRLHKQYGDLAFYILNIDAHTSQFLAMISQMVDVRINFKVEETENKLKSYMQVVKSPFPIDTRRLYYEIGPNGNLVYY
ncbi:MAG: hypothetical protein QXO71_05295 [Candidatus Jordarchaeaceae archaeon]